MPTIVPKDEANLVEIAQKLIAVAGADQSRIKTITAGGATAFEVDDELAAAITKKPAAPKRATPPTTAAKPSTDQ